MIAWPGVPPDFLPSLTVVVPAYNERDNLERVLAELCAACRPVCAHFEVLVVDDGSKDGSADWLAKAPASEPALRIVSHPTNLGLTARCAPGSSRQKASLSPGFRPMVRFRRPSW